MKFLLTFLVTAVLSLPVFAQTTSSGDQSSLDSSGSSTDTQSYGTPGSQGSEAPQAEEDDSTMRSGTVTPSDDTSIQEEEDTEETMRTDSMDSSGSSSESSTTTP